MEVGGTLPEGKDFSGIPRYPCEDTGGVQNYLLSYLCEWACEGGT